jgi:hypothetical protein
MLCARDPRNALRHGQPGHRFRLGAALLGVVVAACSSQPKLRRQVTIAEGQQVRVVLAGTSTRPLELRNLPHSSPQAFYSDPQTSSTTKIVADAELQTLLDVLAATGMFAAAGPTEPPGSKDTLTVEIDGKRHVWSRPRARQENLAAIKAFDQGRNYVISLFNSTMSLHTTDLASPDGRAMREAIERSDKPTVQLPETQGKGTQPEGSGQDNLQRSPR